MKDLKKIDKNLYGNINEFGNKNKDMYNTIEKSNIKMFNKSPYHPLE